MADVTRADRAAALTACGFVGYCPTLLLSWHERGEPVQGVEADPVYGCVIRVARAIAAARESATRLGRSTDADHWQGRAHCAELAISRVDATNDETGWDDAETRSFYRGRASAFREVESHYKAVSGV